MGGTGWTCRTAARPTSQNLSLTLLPARLGMGLVRAEAMAPGQLGGVIMFQPGLAGGWARLPESLGCQAMLNSVSGQHLLFSSPHLPHPWCTVLALDTNKNMDIIFGVAGTSFWVYTGAKNGKAGRAGAAGHGQRPGCSLGHLLGVDGFAGARQQSRLL